ncbi:TPA: phage tail assembly protein [Citrobacter freundii]|uniref:phage tail assembly protein n=1 Tax=Citrobacter freundii TaxID=546 RepID=UPI001BCD69E4|nr:phage tail assembly protein [Citrobacter freundii]MDT7160501.1 phage tail assembly protein [Citrobacter freundii]HBN2655591.1 phage tail assembly protein [Citrobacter freundii]HBN2665203.1 phage tail assembly protein [Citrobacter freundii]HBN2676161.1 phage tail assembly protein [Citrobacter freundii]HBN2681605.1 phage tail assembly protein [Citrobacter freundii]
MSKKTDNAITLAKPVVRGDEKITQVAITDEIKQAGSLRGLKLVNVMNMDVDSVAVLLTRVTSPRLKQTEINEMDTRDFVSLSEALVPFLTPAESGSSSEAETENQ